MYINDRILTGHIYEEAVFLYTQSQQCSRYEFLGSGILKRSFARGIDIIGETSKKLSPEFKSYHPQANLAAIDMYDDNARVNAIKECKIPMLDVSRSRTNAK